MMPGFLLIFFKAMGKKQTHYYLERNTRIKDITVRNSNSQAKNAESVVLVLVFDYETEGSFSLLVFLETELTCEFLGT
jgi:hypothetical protein